MANYVYTSDTLASVRRAILSNLTKHRGERNIVIVPDQFSLSVESEVLDILGTQCCFDVDVTSFSRYADTVLGRQSNTLNKQTSVMLLSRVIILNQHKLIHYKNVALRKGFAEEMYAVITNIRNSGVSVARLNKALPHLRGMVANKLKDIILLYSEYLNALEDYNDMTTMLELLKCRLAVDSEVRTTNYYITDFMDMAHVKYELTELIAANAKNLYLGYVEGGVRNSGVYNAKFRDKIIGMCDVAAEEVAIVPSELNSEQTLIKDNIFSYGVNAQQIGADSVSCAEADTIEEEIEYAAMYIRDLVVSKKLRYRDIAVALPNVSGYAARVKRIFDRYEVAYYLDDKYPLSKNTSYNVLKFALAAMDLDAQSVLNFVKENAFGADYGDVIKFENFMLANNISGVALRRNMHDAAAEKVRLRAMQAIDILRGDDFKQPIDALQLAARVSEFYNYLGVARTLAQELTEPMKSINPQILTRITEVLVDLKKLFCSVTASCETLYSIFLTGLESVKFATVPLFIDSVFVGDSADSRFAQMEALFILGANEGVYPTISEGKGIISITECEELARCGIDIENAYERNNKVKANLLQLIIKPQQLVVIARTGEQDSLLKLQLQRLFNIRPIKAQPRMGAGAKSTEEAALKAATRANLNYEYSRGGIILDVNQGHAKHEIISDSYALVGDVAFKDGRVSASAIERFYSCPYNYYCNYVLRIKPREIAAERVMDIGSLMHETLEIFYTKQIYLQDNIPQRIGEIVNSIIHKAEYAMLLNAGGNAVKQSMIKRAVRIVQSLDANRMNSAFVPTYCEYTFGADSAHKGLKFEINADGKNGTKSQMYELNGKIDRIDICGDYMAIIDYKSSAKEVKTARIEKGSMLQLPLYFKAACNNLGKKPAAMLYATMPAKYINDDDGEVGKSKRYQGYVIDDDKILEQLDNSHKSSNSYLPAPNKLTAKGAVSGERYRITADEFKQLASKAELMVKQAISLILSHEACPTPVKGTCDYCEYVTICRRADEPNITRSK